MHNDDFGLDFSIDDILSEFTENTSTDAVSSSLAPRLQYPEDEFPASVDSANLPGEETAVYTPVPSDEAEEKITHFAEKYRKTAQADNPEGNPSPRKKKSSRSEKETDVQRREKKEAKRAEREAERARKRERKAQKAAARLEKPPRDTFADVMPRWLVRFVGLILTAVLLLFILCRVVPASGSAAATKAPLKTADISSAVSRYAEEKTREAALAASAHAEELALQQALEQASVRTIYKIAEDATVAPAPLASGFGQVSTANAAEILPIIQQARDSGLLGAEERVVFDPNVEFNTGSYYQDIQYYLDDTLLVICWKEIIDGNTCTFCEVKMQDGSQFRRKLAGDMFGSDILEYTTSMHKATNAVVSMNADYYRFRDMGIVAYNRQLQRFNESLYLNRYGQDLKKYNCVDTLFVTASGDFLFFHQYEETTPEAMQQFIQDNDIVFSIAFGPILVENGMLNTSRDFEEEWYPIGEVNTGYSRAGIGQVGQLHYLYMSLNHSDEKAARWRVKEFGQHFYEKGVLNAYNLDGGQTGEIVFQGNEAYNHVDHVNGTSSRQVSDMIYFASAINGEEVTQ